MLSQVMSQCSIIYYISYCIMSYRIMPYHFATSRYVTPHYIIPDINLYTTTNKCLQCLIQIMYSISNNWCICINVSCGHYIALHSSNIMWTLGTWAYEVRPRVSSSGRSRSPRTKSPHHER